MLAKPTLVHREWLVSGHPDVLVRLTERPGINLYTSVETVDNGTWTMVKDSARGHGDNLGSAEERVQRLLSGGWLEHVPEEQLSISEILKRPYARTFLLNERGIYTALILEFPGCISQGQGIKIAYDNLESAADAWLRARIDQDASIPEPFENGGQSVGVLQKLWAASSEWQHNFPKDSPEKLSRDVLKILQRR